MPTHGPFRLDCALEREEYRRPSRPRSWTPTRRDAVEPRRRSILELVQPGAVSPLEKERLMAKTPGPTRRPARTSAASWGSPRSTAAPDVIRVTSLAFETIRRAPGRRCSAPWQRTPPTTAAWGAYLTCRSHALSWIASGYVLQGGSRQHRAEVHALRLREGHTVILPLTCVESKLSPEQSRDR